ncbi:hypothetical protein B9G55_01545 [Saccharibacillus sp. O16]|nr:hypothetical protein B9G55_01545 [Saccharibacillus sp. O16]
MEIPKRKSPSTKVLRELYMKSGNQCAFRGCNRMMVNENGDFVGQVCHIEGAEPGGERFNPNQTNDERADFSNLMLMCYDHHVETNNTVLYTVELLKEMKKEHESKFSDLVRKMEASLGDLTQLQEFTYIDSARNFSLFVGDNLNEEEQASINTDLNELVDKLRLLPPDTRIVFKVAIRRSEKLTWGIGLTTEELRRVMALSHQELRNHLTMLIKYGLLTEPEEDPEAGGYATYLPKLYGNWNVWFDLRRFCEHERISLEKVIVEMQFHLIN